MSFIRKTLRKKAECLRCGTQNNKKFDTKNSFSCMETYRKHVFISTEPLIFKKIKWLTN